MQYLVRFDAVSLSFGDQVILSGADLRIDPGERLCLIGRNGAGKSTSLKLISGELEPDEGTVDRPQNLRLAVLEQALAEASDESARDFVAHGLAAQIERIARYRELADAAGQSREAMREVEALEREILAGGGWAVDAQIEATLSRLGLPGAKPMRELSGGWRRRAALGRALVGNPELLLLDEPTNHLDISTIEWLENEIRRYDGAVLFVTHDRSFVERVATRIVDIDRGQLRSWPGGYRDYVRRRKKAEVDEDATNREFDKKLAGEETWIRQGVKAREHRNEGRVRALEALRDERAARIKRPRTARIHINAAEELSGRKVIDARNVTHGFDGAPLLRGFSFRVMRGDRIGIIGNNGVGKSTILRILLGELEPDKGSVKLGTHLKVGYFDQLRRELDTSRTVAELVGEGRDYIDLNGRKKHVIAYLTDFLFTAKRARTRIVALSGGERNRVILAKLFTEGSNLLVLDEPTNDLDVETLEALEQRLGEYSGTLLVVSHDRHFLDAVVTKTLVFEADGAVKQYAGGYSDWARQHRALALGDDKPPGARSKSADRPKKTLAPGKLSYKLKLELEALPERIERLEGELDRLNDEISDPDFYKQDHAVTSARLDTLKALEQELSITVERWAELEQLAGQGA
ncbi:MAG TPA: ATP-binding cassette domain-containing protein [Gammaproteobacteria bacterium]|nr:ATP-binding cassette domain-containing protein [Gammaproteobacteria bacterium]